jgi:hypothetical protein
MLYFTRLLVQITPATATDLHQFFRPTVLSFEPYLGPRVVYHSVYPLQRTVMTFRNARLLINLSAILSHMLTAQGLSCNFSFDFNRIWLAPRMLLLSGWCGHHTKIHLVVA